MNSELFSSTNFAELIPICITCPDGKQVIVNKDLSVSGDGNRRAAAGVLWTMIQSAVLTLVFPGDANAPLLEVRINEDAALRILRDGTVEGSDDPFWAIVTDEFPGFVAFAVSGSTT